MTKIKLVIILLLLLLLLLEGTYIVILRYACWLVAVQASKVILNNP